MSAQTPFLVFSGTNSRYLAEKICNSLGCPLGQMNIQHFADGEFAVSYEESIRGRDVFLVQSTFPNSDNLMELLLMIDAAKRASAHSVIAVIPYFGWARQDRKDKPRVSIGAKLIADMLSTAGIDRLITMDLHADQIQGFFNVPVDHLYASSIFLDYIKTSLPLDNLCIATPDVGGTKRASSYSKYLGLPMVICHKSRLRANEVAEMRIIGDVKGLDVLLIDDMVDTAGTITKAANLMLENGAKSVRAIASHAVMSDPASTRVDQSALTEMIFTDSIPYAKKCEKVKVLSGGERTRLAMIKLLLEPVNFLILDEPTNHLDMRSKDVLKDAIREFDGTVILVSHDRDFLDGLATKVYEFGGGIVKEHLGGIYDFLQKKQIESLNELQKAPALSTSPSGGKENADTATQSSGAKLSYEEQKELNKKLKKLERRVADCESEIEQTESAIAILEARMATPEGASDMALYEQHQKLKQQLDSVMEEWDAVSTELEAVRKEQ